MPDFRLEQLRNGLSKATLTVDDNSCWQLIEYLNLLSHWNKSINLTAIRDSATMVEKHLLDSLAVLPFIQGGRVLDVGTGAGLPGIPLALADKKTQYTLLDSRGKRLRFLFDVKTKLQMNNIELIESRVENYQPREGFDVIVSRAFSSLADFTALAGHCLKDGGRILAMKATTNEEELRAVKKPYIVAATHQLPLFGGATHRQLVEIHKNKEPGKVLQ